VSRKPTTTIRRGQGPVRTAPRPRRYRTAEESSPSGRAIARPRTHPPRPAALRAALPPSKVRACGRFAPVPGFLRRLVAQSILPTLTTLTARSRASHDQREQTTTRFGVTRTPMRFVEEYPTDPPPPKTWSRCPAGRGPVAFLRPVRHFLSYASQRHAIILPTSSWGKL
jgi:hypothetical protein